MKKKILMGSIIAVVMLILLSFTSVVGFQSMKSDTAIASPLFGIRTNKVFNIKQDAVKSDYIGKGKTINLLLPKRNNKAELVDNFVEYIKMMDDEAFNRFVKLTIGQLYEGNDFKGYSDEYVVNALNQLRDNQEENKNIIYSEVQDNSHITRGGCMTTFPFCASTGGFIQCFLELIFVLTFLFFSFICKLSDVLISMCITLG